jgi:serine/threonine protein kinase
MRDDEGGWNAGEPPALPPGTLVAGFTLHERLASGSSGSVYRAERGGRPFALKLIPWGSWAEREVDALRRVRHASVVGLLGYGQWPEADPRYLVLELEWVDGPSLDAWARQAPRTALELTQHVLRPLVQALGEVHAAGVVHRDVKEANVVMRREDGQPVLVDFGAAAYEGAPRLTQRLPPGTPEYRSPEMLRFAREWEGEPYTSRPGDDLWALGVMLYALLTRTLPFGDRHGPLVRSILQQAPEPPHARNPHVPPALGALCLRLLEKAPEARFPDAPSLARALEALQAQADDTWRVPLFADPAPRPAPPPRTARPPRRTGRRALGLGALAALGLVVSPARGPEGLDVASTPRSGLTPPHPSLQAGFRREMAPRTETAEVGPSAERVKSPLPAPVAQATHREKTPMRPSSPARSSVSTTVLTAATCLGAACVTPPRPPPPPAECPPGSEETRQRFGLRLNRDHPVVLGPVENFVKPNASRLITVENGAHSTLWILTDWGTLPDGSTLDGAFFFRDGRVDARYTQATLPSGEVVPICATFYWGVEMKPGSGGNKALIDAFPDIKAVERFR